MDVDGNGNISQSELLSTAKSVQEIDAYMREAMVSGGSGLPKVRAGSADHAPLLDTQMVPCPCMSVSAYVCVCCYPSGRG